MALDRVGMCAAIGRPQLTPIVGLRIEGSQAPPRPKYDFIYKDPILTNQEALEGQTLTKIGLASMSYDGF